MKSLDLKSANVQALNDDELRLVDGGGIIEGMLVAYFYEGLTATLNDPGAFWEGVVDCFE